jgi:prepilin-type N-terminal cleavage/methylation domain-containing protein
MRHHSRRARAGFTVVEMLVALVVAAVGLLALVGADTNAWRRRLQADRALRAAALARARVESLIASGCASTSGSIAHANGIAERWSATRRGPLLLADASAEWPTAAGRDSVRLAGSRWCDR